MFKKLLGRKSHKTTELSRDLIRTFNAELANEIADNKFIFQQDIVEDIREAQSTRIPTEDSVDLSSTVCAGVSYWTALSIFKIEKRTIIDFIEDVYSPSRDIKHTLGLNHVKFIQYLGKSHPNFYGLTLNPFRQQDPKKFREYKGYTGKKTEGFFDQNYKSIHNTSSALKAILNSGGLGVVSIQATFNSYSANFHDILVLGYNTKRGSFLILDPDARVYFNPQKSRPKEVIPVSGYPGLYTVGSDYMDKNTYREKPSPGGITIGLFKS